MGVECISRENVIKLFKCFPTRLEFVRQALMRGIGVRKLTSGRKK
jgi:hypothetical protein